MMTRGDATSMEPLRPTPVRRRIGLLVVGAIPDDPRVRRQGDAFSASGWEVLGIGLPGGRSQPPEWPTIAVPDPEPAEPPRPPAEIEKQAPLSVQSRARPWLLDIDRNLAARAVAWVYWRILYRGVKWIYWRVFYPPVAGVYWRIAYRPVTRASRLARRLSESLLVRVQPARAEPFYWRLNPAYDAMYRAARDHKMDVWLANDWTAGPIARRLAQEQDVAYGYDTHELTVEEYAHSWHWRLLQRPFRKALKAQIVDGAAVVSCVSQGIADRMAAVHRMRQPPMVIRNVPLYQEHRFRPTGDVVNVLYHGIVVPGRGIEECIRSLPRWPARFHFTVRGPADPSYLTELGKLARGCGVTDRVTFAPAVPMTEMVRRAAEFDVGIFVLPVDKQQNTYVLPNKLFEYLMAGLAIAVSATPEMAAIVQQHQAGVLISDLSSERIAAVIQSLDNAQIDAFKRNALAAARVLNWEIECQRLLQEYADAVDRAADVRQDIAAHREHSAPGERLRSGQPLPAVRSIG